MQRVDQPSASPPATVLTPGQQARRQRVVEAALRLSNLREFDRIQVKDVAEEAGVALGTVYHYFSSKDHLFAEVLVAWAATLRSNITRHPLAGTTPGERLAEVFHRSVRAFQRQPYLAKLIARLEVSPDPYATEILFRLSRTTDAVYREALDGVDPDFAGASVRVVGAVLSSVLRAWSADRMLIVDALDRIDEAIVMIFGPLPVRD